MEYTRDELMRRFGAQQWKAAGKLYAKVLDKQPAELRELPPAQLCRWLEAVEDCQLDAVRELGARMLEAAYLQPLMGEPARGRPDARGSEPSTF
jgi:hypothetical protein